MTVSNLTFNPDETLSPESRAAVLGTALRFMTLRIEPVSAATILAHVMEEFDAPEEDVASAVRGAFFHLLLVGLIDSADFNAEQRELIIQEKTSASPSQILTSFVWGEPEQIDD